MARIQQTIETSKSAFEMRNYVETKVLIRPELKVLISEYHWVDNKLYAEGKLGKGTITLLDNKVIIDIELSLFGTVAKGQIEQTLQEQFKKLN